MLSVRTKCLRGVHPQILPTGHDLFRFDMYSVVCPNCGYSTKNLWQTMTLAIIDWDDDIKRQKGNNSSSSTA